MLPRAMWARARIERKHAITNHDSPKSGYGAFSAAESKTRRAVNVLPRTTAPSLGEDWMSCLDDGTLLSALSIPGTHDSAAFTYSWPFIQTQTMNIDQQLNAGVRYFDLRCGVRRDIVEMVHGPSILGITLNEVLSTICEWLDSYPSEAIVVQIKQDRKPEKSTVHFSQAIVQCLALRAERWRTANTTPTLGELRGKIQLFRRFNGPGLNAYGIDVTKWKDNSSTPFTIYTRNHVRITIQDHYSFPDPQSLPALIAKKGDDVSQLLDHAASNPHPGHWYMNFTSAYEFNLYYQLPPREVAVGGYWGFTWESGMNPRLRTFLREHRGRRRWGIVAMDFPELGSDDLIAALIQSNFPSEKSLGEGLMFWLPVVLVILILTAAVAYTSAWR